MRVVFMGTPDFAVPSLKALLAAHEVVAVYTQPPKPAHRGQMVQLTPVHQVAQTHQIPVHTPTSLKSPDAQAALAALQPDVIIVAAYGLLLPQAVLDIPRLGCWNVHASLLPRWRGAAPIQHAIWAGDTETGITIMVMEAGLDTGPMLLRQAIPITADTTASTLHDTLATLGATLLQQALPLITAGTAPTPQPQGGVTYAAKLTKADGALDWRQPAAQLERQIRALNPWPGTFFMHDETLIKVSAAAVAPYTGSAQPGTVLDAHGVIACNQSALRLLTAQRPGGRPLAVDEFLRGYPLPMGTVLAYPTSNQ